MNRNTTTLYTIPLYTILREKIFILTLILITSCDLRTNKEIDNPDKIFTPLELRELNGIVTEFDKILIAETNENDVEKAYKEYSLSILETNVIPNLNGTERLEDSIMNLNVFSKIWNPNIDQHVPGKFWLKSDSDYMRYLEHRGEKTEFIKSYVKNYKSTFDLTPSLVSGFAKNIDDLNLKDINNRLIVAIHYLTLLNR